MPLQIPKPILDATRLSRQGRLADATRLLRDQLVAPVASSLPGVAAFDAAGLVGRLRGLVDGAGREAPVHAPAPSGARFEARSYKGAGGERPYKLYVPGSLVGRGPVPLIVMLHGCKQNPDDFAAGTRMNELAERRGFLVAYPGQVRRENPALCWNWFEPTHQRRDGGEASIIAGITRAVLADERVDPDRVYVAGLSAGGATAAIMGAAYPDLFAAIGVHSGLACGAARDVSSAFNVMQKGPAAPAPAGAGIPAIIFHGDRDGTVNPANADAVARQALGDADGVSAVTEEGRSSGGRAFTRVVRSRGGKTVSEHWTVSGGGHAWSGGSPDGSYTDPLGPDASAAMVRFFEGQRRTR